MSKTSRSSAVLRYATANTVIGPILAVFTDRGLCALRLLEGDVVQQLMAELSRAHPEAEWVEATRPLASILKKIKLVLAGKLHPRRVPLDMYGTPFQKRVWSTMLQIPWGATLSYQELARKVGRPRAVRAVASACARNPVAFIVPCHRILRSDGSLGGYYWGTDRKQELLTREQKLHA